MFNSSALCLIMTQLWALFGWERTSTRQIRSLQDQSSVMTEKLRSLLLHTQFCVCVSTAPVRSLAGPMAVGGLKRQLFVSTFHENLWLNLSRARTNSLLLSVQSGRRRRKHSPQAGPFQSVDATTGFKGDRKATASGQMCTSPICCDRVFRQAEVSFPSVPVETSQTAGTKASFDFLLRVTRQLCPLSRALEHLRLLPRSSAEFSTASLVRTSCVVEIITLGSSSKIQ